MLMSIIRGFTSIGHIIEVVTGIVYKATFTQLLTDGPSIIREKCGSLCRRIDQDPLISCTGVVMFFFYLNRVFKYGKAAFRKLLQTFT